MKLYLYVLILFLLPFTVIAKTKVVDGDSLEINSARIRLIGIDSPEYGQFCHKPNGAKYDCGEAATNYMKSLVEKGKVVCFEQDLDRYNRHLSICFVDEAEPNIRYNINIEMLKAGWAVVYRTEDKEYIEAENYAKQNKLGIWQGKFMRPEFYRALNR